MAELYLQNRPTFISGLAQGIEAMSGLATNRARTKLMQQQAQQQDKYAKAVDEYGKTGDPNVFKGVDPEAYFKISQYAQSQPPQEVQGLASAADALANIRGAINPQTWPGIKQSLVKREWIKPDTLPDQISDAQLNQFVYAGKLINAQIKQTEKGPQLMPVAPGGTVINKATGQSVYQAPGATTTLLDPRQVTSGQQVPKEHQFIPQPKEHQPNEAAIVTNALKEKLGREPSATEISNEMLKHKKEVAVAQGSGRLEGVQEATKEQVDTMIDAVGEGRMVPSYVKNAFGQATSNQVLAGVMKKYPEYNDIEAEANNAWYKNRATQTLIRRTESIVAPGGALDEFDRLAKQVNNPAGTPLNKIKGKIGVALGDSQRQLLDLVHGISSEEMQQIFGAQGGGEKFLALSQSLADPNLSVQQLNNAVKELKYMIITRQAANVRGTPAQGKWKKWEEDLKKQRPYAGGETTWSPGQPRTQRFKNKAGEDVTDQLSDDVYKATVEHHDQ